MTDAFDQYADDYDTALARGVSLSGEDKDFFARGRIAWMARQLRREGEAPQTILDFGCGTGTATPHLLALSPRCEVIGVDTSAKSIAVAQKTHFTGRVRFMTTDAYRGTRVELAYCNGVFHHIPPAERGDALAYIRAALGKRGLLAFFENNPWNPGTRWVMRRIPFDRDAILLTAGDARRMLRKAGFDIVITDYLFVFPHILRGLRPIEPHLSRFPFGAQYGILCRCL